MLTSSPIERDCRQEEKRRRYGRGERVTETKKGDFEMKGSTPELINTYWCRPCRAAGIEHEVASVPGPATDQSNWCGAGLPTTFQRCTGCGAQTGPWIDAKYVDGAY
jgi:hypothetical protein